MARINLKTIGAIDPMTERNILDSSVSYAILDPPDDFVDQTVKLGRIVQGNPDKIEWYSSISPEGVKELLKATQEEYFKKFRLKGSTTKREWKEMPQIREKPERSELEKLWREYGSVDKVRLHLKCGWSKVRDWLVEDGIIVPPFGYVKPLQADRTDEYISFLTSEEAVTGGIDMVKNQACNDKETGEAGAACSDSLLVELINHTIQQQNIYGADIIMKVIRKLSAIEQG